MSPAELLVPVVECAKASVLSCFGAVFGAEPSYLGMEEAPPMCDGVVGLISLLGERASWTMAVGLPAESASAIVSGFVGFPLELDSPDLGDATGELANILAGYQLAEMENAGLKAAMSIPMVVRGADLSLHAAQGTVSQQLRFEVPEGKFWVLITTPDVGGTGD
jgi:CheY-specific phosphatase CheX